MTVFPWPVVTTDEESDFITRLPFPPDGFQRDAFAHAEAEHDALLGAGGRVEVFESEVWS